MRVRRAMVSDEVTMHLTYFVKRTCRLAAGSSARAPPGRLRLCVREDLVSHESQMVVAARWPTGPTQHRRREMSATALANQEQSFDQSFAQRRPDMATSSSYQMAAVSHYQV